MDLILGLLILAVVDLFMPTSIACTAYLVTKERPYRNSLVFIASNYLCWLMFGLVFFMLFGALWLGTVLAWYARDYVELAVGVCLIGIGAFSHVPQFSLSRFDKHLTLPKLGLAGVVIALIQLPSSFMLIAAVALMHQHGVGIVAAVPLLMAYCVSFVFVSLGIVGVRFLSGDHYSRAVGMTYTYVINPFRHIFRLTIALVGVAFVIHWSILHLVFGLHNRPDWQMPERLHSKQYLVAPTAR